MLFNEPKLLKFVKIALCGITVLSFSALQRAEIAEIHHSIVDSKRKHSFSALQRAEIAEMTNNTTNK